MSNNLKTIKEVRNTFKILGLVVLGSVVATSCSEDTYYINSEVLNKEVTLSTQGLISSTTDVFSSNGYQTLSTTANYTHNIPNEFKAYFVSKEDRGQYVVGQVVRVEDVVTGDNSFIIPELEYDIYVTNYDHPNHEETISYAWYTWGDAVQQLPFGSDELYLFGTTVIDYKEVDAGEVTLENHYSAVMISNNEFVVGSPTHYTSNQQYTDANTSWYLKYIRYSTTNTGITIKVNEYSNTVYNLDKPIEANKIYKYTIDGNVQDKDGGGLTVVVESFTEEVEEVIEVL